MLTVKVTSRSLNFRTRILQLRVFNNELFVKSSVSDTNLHHLCLSAWNVLKDEANLTPRNVVTDIVKTWFWYWFLDPKFQKHTYMVLLIKLRIVWVMITKKLALLIVDIYKCGKLLTKPCCFNWVISITRTVNSKWEGAQLTWWVGWLTLFSSQTYWLL